MLFDYTVSLPYGNLRSCLIFMACFLIIVLLFVLSCISLFNSLYSLSLVFVLLFELFFAFLVVFVWSPWLCLSSLYHCSNCLVCLFRFWYNLFWFLCDLHGLVCSVYLFWFLCDIHDKIEFTRCVFSTYTLHSTSNTIVSFSLQSTICINYFKPTLLLRKHQTVSLLFSFSSKTKSLSLLGRMISSGFMFVNSVLHSGRTKSSSLIMYCKKAGDK